MATSKHTGEENPIIISIWLVTENHNLETLSSPASNNFFNEASTGHPISDDY
jgi:hypothetical protein